MQRHGFIRSELELKTLILYVLRRSALPVTFETLTDMVMCDDAIIYFDFVTCLTDLVTTGHVHRECLDGAEMYFISQKGRTNLDICVKNLALSVRDRADNAVDALMRRLRREGAIDATLITRDDGKLAVSCRLRDDTGEILALEIAVLTNEQGRTLINNFKRNAESIFNVLLAAMLDDSST